MEVNQSGEVFAAIDAAELARLRAKYNLRREALLVGLPMIFLMLGMLFTQTLIYRVGVALGIENIADYLSSPGGSALLQVGISSLCFIGLFSLFGRASGQTISRLVPLGRPKKGVTLPLVLFGLGVCSFANLGTGIVEQYFSWIPVEYHWSYAESATGVFGVCMTLISSAVVPALVEEFACRGVIYGLLEKYGQDFAVIVSAVLFGLMHGNFSQIPFAMAVGFAMGFLRAKSGSLWPAVLLHFLNNAIAEGLSYLSDATSAWTANMAQLIYFCVALLCGIIGIVWLMRRDETAWQLKPYGGNVSLGKRCGWFFTAPSVIIFMVIVLGEACQFFL